MSATAPAVFGRTVDEALTDFCHLNGRCVRKKLHAPAQ
jgi:hypothetical protein